MEDSHEQRTSEHASRGGAPPPYDPKMQWRVYREQQRAAWRAQRDAWRAQRHAWKASYAGPYGPRVPSVVGPVLLVCIGVIALLVVTGHIDSGAFWTWYGRWWPLLLIVAGLALLARVGAGHAAGNSRCGAAAASSEFLSSWRFWARWRRVHNHFPGPWNGDFGDNDFFNVFGMPEHDLDQAVDNRHDSGECVD